MTLPPAMSRSGVLRFSISGHMRDAPKFEKSHHLKAGLALTGPFNHPHPPARRTESKSPNARALARLG